MSATPRLLNDASRSRSIHVGRRESPPIDLAIPLPSLPRLLFVSPSTRPASRRPVPPDDNACEPDPSHPTPSPAWRRGLSAFVIHAAFMRLAEERAAGGYERWERRAERPMLALALLFLIVLALPLAVDLPPAAKLVLGIANVL